MKQLPLAQSSGARSGAGVPGETGVFSFPKDRARPEEQARGASIVPDFPSPLILACPRSPHCQAGTFLWGLRWPPGSPGCVPPTQGIIGVTGVPAWPHVAHFLP